MCACKPICCIHKTEKDKQAEAEAEKKKKKKASNFFPFCQIGLQYTFVHLYIIPRLNGAANKVPKLLALDLNMPVNIRQNPC